VWTKTVKWMDGDSEENKNYNTSKHGIIEINICTAMVGSLSNS